MEKIHIFYIFLFLALPFSPTRLEGKDEKIWLKGKYVLHQKRTYAYLLTDKFVFPKEETGKVRFSMVIRFLLVYQLEPVKITKTQVSFAMTFRRIFLYRWQGGMFLQYDTKRPPKTGAGALPYILHLLLHPIIGKTIMVHTDIWRKKVDVQGSQALFKKAIKSIPPAYRSLTRNILIKLFSKKALESFFYTCHPPLPPFPTKKGDSWKMVRFVPRLGCLEVVTFTFKGVRKNKGKTFYMVSKTSKMEAAKDPLGAGGYRFIQGSASGYVIFDQNGFVLKSNTLATLNVVMPASGSSLKGLEEVKSYIVQEKPKNQKKKNTKKES